MSIFSRNLKQCITHWVAKPNSYGGNSFTAPRELRGRWEDTNLLFRLPSGEEQVSTSIIYLEEDVAIGDYLLLGSSSSEDPIAVGAKQIKQYMKQPDLRNLEQMRKAII